MSIKKPIMRIRHFLLALSVLSLFPLLLLGAGGTLRVTATNVTSDAGSIVVRVYENSDTWLGDNWRTRKIVKVAGHRTDDTVIVELQLPPGEYALHVFQDINDDGKLARNFLGMSKEPAGFSNNVKTRLGSPGFRDASFKVGDAPVVQSIRLE